MKNFSFILVFVALISLSFSTADYPYDLSKEQEKFVQVLGVEEGNGFVGENVVRLFCTSPDDGYMMVELAPKQFVNKYIKGLDIGVFMSVKGNIEAGKDLPVLVTREIEIKDQIITILTDKGEGMWNLPPSI